MQLSTKTRYAIRLLFEMREPGPPVATALLAEQTGIALKTVGKIHTTLKRNGITDGTVGMKGGIFLLVPLTAISLGQIAAIFDNGIGLGVCYGNKANECPNQHSCDISAVWGKISRIMQDELNGIFLWDILSKYPENSCSFPKKLSSAKPEKALHQKLG